ncbi:hypothetical protein FR932_05915 [Moritella marina ATCC 15381]|uniref:Uncharacterized protein n=1 Tax=Moritella marina ATCC 15381 TaxID=1202962 RepID=A0A5J6WJF9_MORMI|nr:hypothetical protein [Moritella marina]QFI37398.1 hypothetical protein FR932_05915 [Moritella marina ATCC 15381]
MSSLDADRLLQDKTLNDDSYVAAVKQLNDLGIAGLMTLEAIEFQTLEIEAVLASCQQLQTCYAEIAKGLPTQLHTCFKNSAISVEQLAALVSLIESAPTASWTLREDSFNCYEMDFRLAELQQQLAILKPLNKKLAPFVNTNTLESTNTLRSIQCCLDNAGMFRWFSAKWRDAKQQALKLAAHEQLKLEDIQLLFPAMIKYVNSQERFDALFLQVPVLAACHEGLNTDVTPLLAVREWYKDIDFVMAEYFFGEKGLLAGLSVIDKQSADDLVVEYHTNLLSLINNLDKKMNKLGLSFVAHETLQQSDADYALVAIELKSILLDALSVLKESGVDANTCLSELIKAPDFNKK